MRNSIVEKRGKEEKTEERIRREPSRIKDEMGGGREERMKKETG